MPDAPDAPGTPVDAIELADAVEAVRFEVGEIHMEFAVTLERTRTAKGGIKAWVVEAGSDLARTTRRSAPASTRISAPCSTHSRPSRTSPGSPPIPSCAA